MAIKATEKAGKYLRNLAHRRFGVYFSSDEEQEYYAKVVELVPQLKPYRFGAFAHIKDLSEGRGFDSIKEYYEGLLANPEEVEHLKVNITYKGSHFFRGKRGWRIFRSKCLPQLEGKDRVRVWCAGCSTGQEVYSLVMALLDHVPAERIEVLATDYNDDLLERCQRASYAIMHLHEIPEHYMRHVVVSETGKRYSFTPEVLAPVTTQNVNLIEDEYPQGFDIISCRNVIKFFTRGVAEGVQERLAASLNPGGFLFLGTDGYGALTEWIQKPARLGLRRIGLENIYQKVE